MLTQLPGTRQSGLGGLSVPSSTCLDAPPQEAGDDRDVRSAPRGAHLQRLPHGRKRLCVLHVCGREVVRGDNAQLPGVVLARLQALHAQRGDSVCRCQTLHAHHERRLGMPP